MFCLETFILNYWEKTWTENQQLFDGIIDVTLFDRVEGLGNDKFTNWKIIFIQKFQSIKSSKQNWFW